MSETKVPVGELSGRELGAAVAREVMGGTCPDADARTVYDETKNVRYGHPSETEHWGVSWHIHGGPRWSYRGPDYAGSMDAAWGVAERLNIGVMPHPDKEGIYVAGYEKDDAPVAWAERWLYGESGDYYAEAPTAPEAICRAALKAVREQD